MTVAWTFFSVPLATESVRDFMQGKPPKGNVPGPVRFAGVSQCLACTSRKLRITTVSSQDRNLTNPILQVG